MSENLPGFAFKLRRIAVAGLCASLFASCASDPPSQTAEAPIAVGARLETFVLEDQHGVTRAVDLDTELLLFSRDMEGGAIIRETLAELTPDELAEHSAVYVADISRMPAIISRTMAIPRMRSRPYPTLLDLEGNVTAPFPSEPEKATAIFLEESEIEEIRFISSVEELRQLFDDD